jgi:hypothetical protein
MILATIIGIVNEKPRNLAKNMKFKYIYLCDHFEQSIIDDKLVF